MGRPRASFMAIRARLPASSGTISSASPLPYGLELPQHSLRALDGFLSLSPTFRLFGANAAWLRLAVISHNVMTALKRLALPADLLTARPKKTNRPRARWWQIGADGAFLAKYPAAVRIRRALINYNEISSFQDREA